MCHIKSGTQIEELYDVQNIVTACILRSQQPFSIPSLTQVVKDSCNGSKISISDQQISELVQDTTCALQRIKLITAYNGQYFSFPQNSIGK